MSIFDRASLCQHFNRNLTFDLFVFYYSNSQISISFKNATEDLRGN